MVLSIYIHISFARSILYLWPLWSIFSRVSVLMTITLNSCILWAPSKIAHPGWIFPCQRGLCQCLCQHEKVKWLGCRNQVPNNDTMAAQAGKNGQIEMASKCKLQLTYCTNLSVELRAAKLLKEHAYLHRWGASMPTRLVYGRHVLSVQLQSEQNMRWKIEKRKTGWPSYCMTWSYVSYV